MANERTKVPKETAQVKEERKEKRKSEEKMAKKPTNKK